MATRSLFPSDLTSLSSERNFSHQEDQEEDQTIDAGSGGAGPFAPTGSSTETFPTATTTPAADASSLTISRSDSATKILTDSLQIIVLAVLLALILQVFLAQATVVYGHSMQPNLNPSDRLVIEKVSYLVDQPQRNNIVVVDLPQMPELLIKRLIGMPGETIAIYKNQLYINGIAIDGPYGYIPDTETFGPVVLGPNSYFVMGDNRAHSNDSRSFGPVTGESLVGKAWIRYWPPTRFKVFK